MKASATQARIPAVGTEFVHIPQTPLTVSRMALGTWSMSACAGGIDIPQAVATIHAALSHGINLIETAPVYGFGMSERILGVALEGMRPQTVIATKTGLEWRGGTVYRNATRARIMQEVDDSLRRLRTDYLDIYQVHWPDPLVPIEETAEAMRHLYEQGKVRAIGVSNFSVAQMERFRQVAPLHVLQAPYNLFERAIEAEILPYCQSNGIVILGDGALCRGLLSGRMSPDASFHDDNPRSVDPKFQSSTFPQYLDAVRQLDELAQCRFQRRVIHLAVRWMLDQGISIAIWDGRHPIQVDVALGVAGWSLDGASREMVERVVNRVVGNFAGQDSGGPLHRA
jgi:aryl-alcohol dehydrogenase-like predicted oxidoreductase